MEYETEELMLAAALRPIAIELRAKALKVAKEQADLHFKRFETEDGATPEQIREADRQTDERVSRGKTFDDEWSAKHPIAEFAPAALAELKGIVDAIN